MTPHGIEIGMTIEISLLLRPFAPLHKDLVMNFKIPSITSEATVSPECTLADTIAYY